MRRRPEGAIGLTHIFELCLVAFSEDGSPRIWSPAYPSAPSKNDMVALWRDMGQALHKDVLDFVTGRVVSGPLIGGKKREAAT